MRLLAAVLCDKATVREGLLHVLGAGISQIHHPEYPASLECELAMLVLVERDEYDSDHGIRVTINSSSQTVAELRFDWPAGGEIQLREPSLPGTAPIAVSLAPVLLPAPDVYSIRYELDGEFALEQPFIAHVSTAAQPRERPAPQASR